jgi:uncharacterized RmlC-like cupin family protein
MLRPPVRVRSKAKPYKAGSNVAIVLSGKMQNGEIELNRGGEVLRGRGGDVIYLPKGIPHSPRVMGNDEATVVVVCVPGGFDRFFAACAEEFKKGEPEMQVLVKLAAEHGIEFLSDPPS